MTGHEQLTQLCERLGAPRAQAETMAAQLLKRADQLATERGVTREAALKRLLDLVVQGRAGEVPAEFAPPPEPNPDVSFLPTRIHPGAAEPQPKDGDQES